MKDLLKWKTVIINGESILEAIDIHTQQKLSFRDSMIIVLAIGGGADTILSEDLSDEKIIKGLQSRIHSHK